MNSILEIEAPEGPVSDGSMGSRVVIIGGGIAGLFTAFLLSGHFEEIIVLERGTYSREPASRPHVPQGAHVHILLARGLEIISKTIPEITTWLDELGLPEKDLTKDVHVRFGRSWLPHRQSKIPLRACTRPVLEHLLLRAVRARPNIKIQEKTKVVALEFRENSTASVEFRRAENITALDADLVIDAGGRSSRAPGWLSKYSIEVPEEIVNAHVSYSSCLFRAPDDTKMDWAMVGNSTQFPTTPENAVIMDIGNDQWLSAVVCYGSTNPPKSVDDFIDHVSRLLKEPYGTLLRRAQPLTDVFHYYNTANRWRRFGQANKWPDRFIVIGDAVCTLNPRYGQGMTLAALAAETLRDELLAHWQFRRSLEGLAAHFQQTLDKRLEVPWRMALLEDKLWVAKQAGKPLGPMQRLMAMFSQRLLETVFTDIDTYVRFMRVAHMLESPKHLMSPATIAKVLFPRFRQASTST